MNKVMLKRCKYIILIVAITLLSTMLYKPTLIGDVNGDGVVNNADLVLVQRHLLKIEELKGKELKRADTNSDGVIDILDLANIQKIILGVD